MKAIPTTSTYFSHHEPPRLEEVKKYFFDKGVAEPEAEDFYYVYEHRHWRTAAGDFYRSWRVIAYRWIASVLHDQSAGRRQPKEPSVPNFASCTH
jgi:hypothetical protein